jgi:hypothetical protein
MNWFRFYHEALDDPKVQKLDPPDFKIWVNLLCLACRHDGKLPPLEDIAFALRLDLIACRSVLDRLSIATLIDTPKGGAIGWRYAIHGWDKRQYKSDTSTERVKRFRERSETVSETPPETETETETETEQKQILERKQRRARGTRLPSDWQPTDFQGEASELEKFRDWAASAPGQKGVKADWDATWRNWMRRVRESKGPAGGTKPLTAVQRYIKEAQELSERETSNVLTLTR